MAGILPRDLRHRATPPGAGAGAPTGRRPVASARGCHHGAMHRRPHRTPALLALATALLVTVGAACSSSDDATTTTDSGGAGTTVAPASSSSSSTAAPTSSTTAPTSSSTAAPTSSSTAAPTSSSTTSTTTAPTTVTLRFDGVGPASFGQPAADAVAALTGALGSPSTTNPWIQPSCELAGPGSDGAYSVVWGGLGINLTGPSQAAATFTGWYYLGGAAGSAPSLSLGSGVGVGDPGTDLASAYGGAATFHPIEIFDAHWEVTGGGGTLWAISAADDPGATITRMMMNPQPCE